MNEKIQVLGLEIDNLSAKDATKRVVSYMETEPVSVVEMVTMNTIGCFQQDEMAKELFDHVAQGCFWPNTRTVELKDRAKQMLKDLGVSFVQQRLHVSDDDDYDEGWTVFPDELGQQYPNEGY